VESNHAAVCIVKNQKRQSKRRHWFGLNWRSEGGLAMDKCLVYSCVIVAACAAAIWIEHKKAILTMLGLQDDERER
jgi:hypothetical protein